MPESVKICAWAVQASALRGYHPLQGIYVGRAGAEKAKTKKRQQTEANNLGMLLWMVAAFAARVYKRWKCVGVTNMSTTSSRHNSLLQAISSLQIFFFFARQSNDAQRKTLCCTIAVSEEKWNVQFGRSLCEYAMRKHRKQTQHNRK